MKKQLHRESNVIMFYYPFYNLRFNAAIPIHVLLILLNLHLNSCWKIKHIRTVNSFNITLIIRLIIIKVIEELRSVSLLPYKWLRYHEQKINFYCRLISACKWQHHILCLHSYLMYNHFVEEERNSSIMIDIWTSFLKS